MRQDQNLYEYLYRSLVAKIESGVFLPDDRLPPQQQICRQYNVGITTVRKVMKLLDQDGYIHTSIGQPAVVTYHASPEARAAVLAARKDEIADAYQGIELLLSALYREGARHCGKSELQTMRQAADDICIEMEQFSIYDQTSLFFTTLTGTFHNRLIADLELDAENYFHIPYIPLPGVVNPFVISAEQVKTWLQKSIDQIIDKQTDVFYERVRRFYQNSAKGINAYLTALSPYKPLTSVPQKEKYWFRVKDRSELYARLAMYILRRIASGEFEDQKYLPSIYSLMTEYGVMKETASRAVALLNSMGIIQTIDKKGTIIASENGEDRNICINFNDKKVRQRVLLCLDALQIMALTVRSCAFSFSSISDEWINTMENKLKSVSYERTSPLSVQLLMSCVIQFAPCHSLQNIYRQLDELMIWGYCLQSVDELYFPAAGTTAEAMKNVVEAFKDKDQQRLPEAIEKAFLQIYRDTHTVISQLPYDFGDLPILL